MSPFCGAQAAWMTRPAEVAAKHRAIAQGAQEGAVLHLTRGKSWFLDCLSTYYLHLFIYYLKLFIYQLSSTYHLPIIYGATQQPTTFDVAAIATTRLGRDTIFTPCTS